MQLKLAVNLCTRM